MFNKRASKYGSVKTEVDGVWFASKKEAERYKLLKTYQQAGVIRDLELQPRYPIVINKIRVCTIIPDFQYFSIEKKTLIVEDSKGVRTPIFQLKKKLFKAVYGKDIEET